MEIKIKLGGWGRKGQHSAQEVNRNLEVQVQALTEALRREKEESAELKEQLAEALRDRIAKGRRLNSVEAVQKVVPIKPMSVVNNGEPVPVRFRLMEGKRESVKRD